MAIRSSSVSAHVQTNATCVCVVSSGQLTVNGDASVQLLAEEAVPLDQLDAAVSVRMSANVGACACVGSKEGVVDRSTGTVLSRRRRTQIG
jgi:hypothetical protein